MVALRSRRLESLFGTSLDALRAEHVHALVNSSAQEAFDLDFKAALYGRGDSERRALAGDVAAWPTRQAVGMAEDDQARAVAAPGVQVTDAEVARIRQVIASLAAPCPWSTFSPCRAAPNTVLASDPISPPQAGPIPGLLVTLLKSRPAGSS